MFIDELHNTEIIKKIYLIVKTKTYRYNITDKAMWDYIRTTICKEVDDHIIEIFNFIMNNIIVLCNVDRNPITYFVSVVNESIKWVLRSVYRDIIIYDDTISTEDIQSNNIDNLNTYCYNDTLYRLKQSAKDRVEDDIKNNISRIVEMDSTYKSYSTKIDEKLIELNDRIESIDYISPLSQCIVFPILSKITNITYKFFKTLSPKDSAYLSYYVHKILIQTFKNVKYNNIFKYLEYYTINQPSVATTYKLKNTSNFLNKFNEIKSFYGFQNRIFFYRTLCHFIGRISRIKFCNIINGSISESIAVGKIENEIVDFYINYFSNKHENKIEDMRKLLLSPLV